MVSLYRDFLEQLNMIYKLELIALVCFALSSALSKPIQKADSAQPNESISKRLNSELQDIVKMTMLQADMHILKTLPEEKLSLIENLLRLWQEEEEVAEVAEEMDLELPQGDEPMEDAYLSDAPELSGDLTRVEFEENSTLGGSYYYDANSSKTYREINKEMRLNSIKSQILTYLGFAGRTPPVVNSTDLDRQRIMDMFEKTKHRPKYPPSESYTEKVQSFYPACDLPRNTTSDLWLNNGTVMNLFFNTIQSALSTSTVLKARLRLFKHSRSPDSLLMPQEECSQTPDERKKTDGALETKTLEDRLIRVSIYWYTRPLKKAKDKKKLLDSQMLSIYGEEWTEWNIKPAVKAWKEAPSKNFGLSVIVEDEDGVKLPVDKLFAAMNCSNEASTTRPFPGFFVHSGREPLESQRSGSEPHWSGSGAHHSSLFPIIDLFSVSDETAGHKVRHHNHHRTPSSH